jgi:hypothetical protein
MQSPVKRFGIWLAFFLRWRRETQFNLKIKIIELLSRVTQMEFIVMNYIIIRTKANEYKRNLHSFKWSDGTKLKA